MQNIPGYGDEASWGPICDPQDPRYDDRTEFAIEKWIETRTAVIVEQKMRDPATIGEAMSMVSDVIWEAASTAMSEEEDDLVGSIIRPAVRAWITIGARKQAEREAKGWLQ